MQQQKFARHQNEDMIIEIAPCRDVDRFRGDVTFAANIFVKEIEKRNTIDLVCVVDKSGSMSEHLETMIRAVKLIAHNQRDQDRIGVVEFNDEAHVVLPLTHMNKQGKERIDEQLKKEIKQSTGGSNIWAGLEAAMGMFKPNSDALMEPVRKRHVVLLTDGNADESPAQGEVAALVSFLESNKMADTTALHTVGVGKDINSELLLELAVKGNGGFAFAPDQQIAEQSVVNCVANWCSVFAPSSCVRVTPANPCKLVEMRGVGEKNGEKFGPFYSGQPRNFTFTVHVPEGHTGEIATVEVICNGRTVQGTCSTRNKQETEDSFFALARSIAVDEVETIVKLCSSGRGSEGLARMRALRKELKPHLERGDERIMGLFQDIAESGVEAVKSPSNFQQWGQHMLRALGRATFLQIRTNDIDPGLQAYGGVLFHKLVSRAKEIASSV